MSNVTGLTIIEQFVIAKSPGRVSEDIIANTGDFVAVIDGVSGKDSRTYLGLTSGRFAAQTIASGIEQLHPEADVQTAVRELTARLRNAVSEGLKEYPAHPPGAVLAIYSRARNEVWRVGDTQVRIGEVTLPDVGPPTDLVATAFRAAALHARLAQGMAVEELRENDPTWDALLALLAHQDVFANRSDLKFGYAVLNGTTVPDVFIEAYPIPSGVEVVLASDGYLSVEGSLIDQEAALKGVLARDPLLITEYLGFRPAAPGGSFDDRAWVRLA